MPTIYDVAKQAGVSTATVSRNFNSGHTLSSDTRKRVQDAAARLNYQPRKAQAAVTSSATVDSKSTISIGLQFIAFNEVDTLLGNDFYGPVLSAALAEADLLDMHLLLNTTSRDKLSQALPQMVRQQAVSGMLLVGSADLALLEGFEEYVPHIVLVDNRDTTAKYDCLYSDGFGGAFEAINYLIGLGHRRIGFVNSSTGSFAFSDRLHGYICAMHEAGIAVDPAMICVASESDDPSEKCVSVADLTHFLSQPNRPTAVMAANDAHALALLHTCRRMSISVPQDISIVGFDDVEFSAHTFPTLTSVRVDKQQLGRTAVRRLYERLTFAADPLAAPQPGIRIELPTRLIVRGSTAPPKLHT